jgi:hypothetical protein
MAGDPGQRAAVGAGAKVPEGAAVHLVAAPEDAEIALAIARHLHMLDVRATHSGLVTAGASERDALLAQVDAAAAVLLVVSAHLHAWELGPELVERALRRRAESTPVIPVLGRAAAWDETAYASLAPLPRDRAPIASGERLREEALADVARAVRGLLARAGAASPLCPFPGLEFFDEDRAADFFGREAEIEEALAKLRDPKRLVRWLPIDGPSGAGKSSFARAGLMPAVRRGALAGGPAAWVVAVMRPGHDPLANLAEALVRAAKPSLAGVRPLDEILGQLRASPTALKSLLREHRPDGHGVLLLVDQLEELFTLARDATAAKQLDALLASALDDRDGPLLLVTTIRSDFAGRLTELPSLAERLNQAARYFLGPMSDAGLVAAMEQPAQRAGLRFEPGLVERILEDARSPGALPLLADVLQALHERREGLELTAAAYVALGGVGGALAMRADATLDALDEDGLSRAKALLLRLVKIGRGSEDTRRPATRSEALAAAGGGEEAERVLAKLSGERAHRAGGATETTVRLVVVSGAEDGEPRVDLVHEALLQRWATLRGWIKEERLALELRDDVEEAARIWESSGASAEALPAGTMLDRFRAAPRAGLHERARRYLDAAEAKWTAQEKRRLEAEKRRLEEEAKQRRLARRARFENRVGVGVLAALAVVCVVGGIYLLRRKSKIEEQQTAERREIESLTSEAGDPASRRDRARGLLLAVKAWREAQRSREPGPSLAEQSLVNAIWAHPPSPITSPIPAPCGP